MRARTPLLLVAATGTGKTTVAELIHSLSGRVGVLTAHTAGEFDRSLERSQIFGHDRGAFTGAAGRHIGVLEEAGDGTLLLDDFHHLRCSTQTLLLRVLDRGAFRRLGGSRDLPLPCRLIIGLAERPDVLVERGRLLAELRFRLGYSVSSTSRCSAPDAMTSRRSRSVFSSGARTRPRKEARSGRWPCSKRPPGRGTCAS